MPRALRVVLIRPSKYDDDGYVVRFFRGVLPSNTLATLAGLTHSAASSGELGDIDVKVTTLDEHVERVDPRRVVRRLRRNGTRIVVGLCGVQSNQFARAADLALQFREEGASVLIGGFHVSGVLATSTTGPDAPLQRLLDAGVTLVRGEVDLCWGSILRDALDDRLQPLYEITPPPCLDAAPVPRLSPRGLRRFACRRFGTVDTSRGCPFSCSFCTIINVQGRTMRSRAPQDVISLVRESYRQGIDYFFFTDDNFARNPGWEAILDGLIALRKDDGIPISFMMQVDIMAARKRRFVEKAAAAGCTQVFVGLESLNPANLDDACKSQNRVGEYATLVDAWHARGIAFHVGYIVGFPHDTLESVRGDVARLSGEIGVDQASFFMLTPLPGSADHARLVRENADIAEDLNLYDSAHPATVHPRMTDDEWNRAYADAWEIFYSIDSMKRVLGRANRNTYWGLFRNFLWYRYSVFVENIHPMLGGLFRLKDRLHRRPGVAAESWLRHRARRAEELVHWIRGVARLFLTMQELWLATRHRARAVPDASTARKAPRIRRLRLLANTRADLDEYWQKTLAALRRGRVLRVNPLRLAVNTVRDAWLATAFSLSMLTALKRMA